MLSTLFYLIALKFAKMLFPLNSTEGGTPYMPLFNNVTLLFFGIFVSYLFHQCISRMFILISCENTPCAKMLISINVWQLNLDFTSLN